jgi:hypothetical protein
MATGPLLDLNTAPRTAVYRKVVQLIRNDATIGRVLRPTSIRAWDGLPQDGIPFAADVAPCIRLTPTAAADNWWSPGSQRGPLFINCEILVKGTCVDDVMNLWWAIVRAIYPAAQSSTNANVLALQQAGAYTGLAEFSLPAFDADPENLLFYAAGQIKIDVNNQLLSG